MYNKLIVIWLFLHIDGKLCKRYYIGVVNTTQQRNTSTYANQVSLSDTEEYRRSVILQI